MNRPGSGSGTRKDTNPVRDDSSAAALMTRARNGEKQAWDELVEWYAPLIRSICRRYRLSRADADDVGQSVWLGLLDHLASLRDPAALPCWLATTTQRECGRVLRVARGPEAPGYPPGAEDVADEQTPVAEDELLTAERHAALREAFTQLPPHCQQLIAMLIHDPPVPYAEISAKLGTPLRAFAQAALPARRRLGAPQGRRTGAECVPRILAAGADPHRAGAPIDRRVCAGQERRQPVQSCGSSCGPPRVVISRASGHGGTSRRPEVPGQFRAGRRTRS